MGADAAAGLATAARGVTSAIAIATGHRVVTAARTARPSKAQSEVNNNGRHQSAAGAPALLPPPQDGSVLRPERAQDRLQGRAVAAALYFRARQDRPLAH